MSEQPAIPTPTRHGNWHVIDGVLVDIDTMTLVDGSKYEPAAPAIEPAPAAPKRAKKTEE